LQVIGDNKITFPIAIEVAERLEALAGIPDPKKWVELMKGYKDITGFESPSELAAYEKGREHQENVMVKFIDDWTPNETNSVIGQLLADKTKQVQAENEQLKNEVEQWNIYSKAVNEQLEGKNLYIDQLKAEIERLKTALAYSHKNSTEWNIKTIAEQAHPDLKGDTDDK
jgi:uncharacterized FlaG/YvyC family protein